MKKSLFLAEWGRIFKSPRDIVQISAILLIPILYAGMFIWAFWDPYGHLNKLPVAVVNSDQGASMEGKKLELGSKLVDNLKEKKELDFHFLSKKEAYSDLNKRKYYMVIEIPENFSSNATTLLDKHPKKLELKYVQNPSMNYTSSKIEDSAVKEIKAGIAKEVTTTYAEEMFKNMKQMANGFAKARDGAGKLNVGAINVNDGSNKLKENLETLASKSIDFNNGLNKAGSGADSLAQVSNTLSKGLNQLATGSNQLLNASKQVENGTGQVASGSAKLENGLGNVDKNLPALISGTDKAKQGAQQIQNQLPDGIASGINQQLTSSTQQLNAGLDQLQTQLGSQLSQGIADQIYQQQTSQIQQLFASLKGKVPDSMLAELQNQVLQNAPSKDSLKQQLSKGINNGLDQGFSQFKDQVNKQMSSSAAGIQNQIKQQIAPSFNQLTSGLETINQNQVKLKNGIDQLYKGSQDLNQGAQKLNAGQQKYVDNMNEFNQQLNRAANGSQSIASGASQLASGIGQLQNGSSQLQNGAGRLADGSKQLADGTSKLNNGSNDLKNSLGDAAKKAGSIHSNNDTYNMVGDPVLLDKSNLNSVPNYGTGLTPYFLSLGLFVGALLLTIVYQIKDPVLMPRNGFTWYLGKFGVMVCVGVIQSLIADAILLMGIGIEVKNVPLFIISTIVTSLTYMAIIQFLVGLLGNPGRYLAIIVLILQLTTSAGTFPLELLPQGLQHLHYALPMAYSLQAFKAVISSGDFSFMWHNIEILCTFMLSFMVLTLVYFIVKLRDSKESIILIEQGQATESH
ncbi:YhgE/Pip domain-containing protein [Heyndrickxia acidicola]|uniref:YhgE/Pip domain-containing protein n=1 Tax=Heyndrickxia acidicola TaxID=209389 RepID=A0ABU6MCQ1_9BACI|nr:YhgE/Pip domain-containing protein [Heyndrickxia acidicola]MED1202448.1 YhgE/Pip domain-containing protein [Heyndrickxia acidicola]